jgi:hypothetical protein
MIIDMKIKDVIKDFEWVIKVLESAETKIQMESVMNCFKSWETKYHKEIFSETESNTIKKLKGNYWSLFKNKLTSLVKI